jgi:hypothetical protein
MSRLSLLYEFCTNSTFNVPVLRSLLTARSSVKNSEVKCFKYLKGIAVLALDECMIVSTSAIRNIWLE